MNVRGRRNQKESGQGLVEYGLILALVSVVAVGTLGGVGDRVSSTFSAVSDVDIDSKIAQGYIPISTAEELDNLRNNKMQLFGENTIWEGNYTSGLDKKYIQVCDIDLSDFVNWKPIGNKDLYFTGSFNGGNYVISQLYSNQSEGFVGLFGRADGAEFYNIGLVDIDVTGKFDGGGLVAHQINGSSVSDSYAVGKVTINGPFGNSVGGLVGYQNYGSTISNSYSNVNVSVNFAGVGKTGGLIGYNQDSFVSNSYSLGNVSGSGDWLGGLVGHNTQTSIVDSSYSNVFMNGDGRVGGLVGYNIGDIIHSGWNKDQYIIGVGVNNKGAIDNGTRGYTASEINEIINTMMN